MSISKLISRIAVLAEINAVLRFRPVNKVSARVLTITRTFALLYGEKQYLHNASIFSRTTPTVANVKIGAATMVRAVTATAPTCKRISLTVAPVETRAIRKTFAAAVSASRATSTIVERVETRVFLGSVVAPTGAIR